MPIPLPLMNQTQYARHRGITRAAVYKKIKCGHIVLNAAGLINVREAKKREQEFAHPRKGRPSPNTPQPDREVGGKTYAQVLRLKEFYKGRREKLAYRREIGQLVLKSAVEKDAFETARIIRDNLLNIPTRVAGELAGELGLTQGQGQEQVFQILNREILQALEGLTAQGTSGTTNTLTP